MLGGSRASMKGLCNHNQRAPATVPRAEEEEEELFLPFFIWVLTIDTTTKKGFPFQELALQDPHPPKHFFVVLNKLDKCQPGLPSRHPDPSCLH